MNQKEISPTATSPNNRLLRRLSRMVVRSRRSSNHSCTGARELSGYESDALDVLVPVFGRKPEFGGELGAYGFAEE